METKSIKKSQGGFTLIEIIAVLVILGILAAVAIPRFLNLQEDARNQALRGAFAAGASQLAMQYASDLLGGGDASTWTYTETNLQLGDFSVNLVGACGNDSSSVTVNALGSPAWVAQVTDKAETYTICQAAGS